MPIRVRPLCLPPASVVSTDTGRSRHRRIGPVGRPDPVGAIGPVSPRYVIATVSGLLLAVRSGGHNAGGLGSCDDGLVIDPSAMKGIHVDPEARTARVQGGCTWGDVDHATHAFGMATPAGSSLLPGWED
jgi:FAD/FMN-containing dehydrogenase